MTSTVRYTVIDGEVIAEKRNGVRKQYVPDPLGSTVALLDNTQTQTDTFSYWPYGEVNTRIGTTPTPFQFVGTLGYYVTAGSRTYVRARELDNQKGRWLTEDPIGFAGGDLTLYRYVYNNPVNYTDPDGNMSDDWGWNGWWVQQNQKLLHDCITAGLTDSNCSGLNKNKVSKMMRCIIGCELDDLPGPGSRRYPKGYPIMQPDPDQPNGQGGVGPCRLTGRPEWGGFNYPNSNWRNDPCDNIKAGISLLCYDIKNRNKPPNSYILPGDWRGDQHCYDRCMANIPKKRSTKPK